MNPRLHLIPSKYVKVSFNFTKHLIRTWNHVRHIIFQKKKRKLASIGWNCAITFQQIYSALITLYGKAWRAVFYRKFVRIFTFYDNGGQESASLTKYSIRFCPYSRLYTYCETKLRNCRVIPRVRIHLWEIDFRTESRSARFRAYANVFYLAK